MQFFTGKVYFELRSAFDKHPDEQKFIVYGNASAETVWSRYLAAENGDVAGSPKYLFYTSDYSKQSALLTEKFQVRKAGGGVVFKGDELLVMKRNGVFDIPKGHLDKGETIEECAVREVEEETGVKAEIEELLHETFHTYIYKKKHVLKHTYWYKMKATENDQELIPQTEEGIETLEWMKINEVKNKVWKNTYKSIKEVFELCGV
ncbi:NUDIX hydrolase [Flammeovirga aprica]|uniref:NUDIX domain-containing protein n=1 Tax=Flammeovirga aprica JL-4 TaxID=694437 RepID=A0A7X9RZI5_9BACT|nr:NUDIX domain-containing protein [Flammeovirga aprica]NME71625.1 NUDIX domain-containing protein [Flammeovirga aprica JL-4]